MSFTKYFGIQGNLWPNPTLIECPDMVQKVLLSFSMVGMDQGLSQAWLKQDGMENPI